MSEEKKTREDDWELSEAYYKREEGEKELSLEDFITEEDLQADGAMLQPNHDELLKKTAGCTPCYGAVSAGIQHRENHGDDRT